MNGGGKTLCLGAPRRLNRTDERGRRIGFSIQAVFHDRFHSHGARDFAVRFAAHAVGKHEEVQRLNDPVAIFVVRTHATHIGHAATYDTHTNSLCRPEITPLATRVSSTLLSR